MLNVDVDFFFFISYILSEAHIRSYLFLCLFFPVFMCFSFVYFGFCLYTPARVDEWECETREKNSLLNNNMLWMPHATECVHCLIMKHKLYYLTMLTKIGKTIEVNWVHTRESELWSWNVGFDVRWKQRFFILSWISEPALSKLLYFVTSNSSFIQDPEFEKITCLFWPISENIFELISYLIGLGVITNILLTQ